MLSLCKLIISLVKLKVLLGVVIFGRFIVVQVVLNGRFRGSLRLVRRARVLTSVIVLIYVTMIVVKVFGCVSWRFRLGAGTVLLREYCPFCRALLLFSSINATIVLNFSRKLACLSQLIRSLCLHLMMLHS